MFLQESGGGGPTDLNSILQNLKSEVTGIQSAILNFEIQAKKVSADIFGRGAAMADEVQKSIAKATQNTVELGTSVEDVAAAFASVATSMGTNLLLSEKNLTTMIQFQKAANITAEDVGKLTEGFSTIGYGITDAFGEMEKMRQTTNKLGLNTAQFMKTVGDNIKLMNSYNFRDGVEGFTRMVARSQALRINMADVKGLAADLLNPEKAIELAANMQMLGGSIAGLSDPFQLMNMAQNDMEGLQNAIIDTAAASVTFNEQTGKFNISATEMRRLRAQAQALGMDYEELADTAVKARMKQEAMGQLRFTTYSEEEKELISNMGQLKDGKLMVALGPNQELVDASALSDKELDKLRKQQEDGNKTAEDIAKEQLTTLETIQAVLLKQLIVTEASIAGGDRYASVTSGLTSTARNLDSQILSQIVNEDNYEMVADYFNDIINGAINNVDTEGGLKGTTKSIIKAAKTATGKVAGDAADAIGGPGTAAAIGTAVENAMTKVFTSTPINMNVGGNIGLQAQNIDFSTLTPQQVQDLGNKIKQWMTSNALGNP